MSMVCGLDLHRQQITFDAMDTVSGEVWRGRVWQPDRDRVRRWLRQDVARRADGQPVGVHGLAVRGRGDRRGGVRGAPRRGGRHPGGPGPQTPRQDRSLRRSTAARTAAAQRAARVVDPAGGRAGVARAGAALQVVGRSTFGVDAADPCRVVPAPRRRPRGTDPLGRDAGLAVRRRRVADPGGASADRGRLHDDRRHRRRSAPAQGAADPVRVASAGLSGPRRQPLRDRRPVGGGGVVRARRLSSLLPRS